MNIPRLTVPCQPLGQGGMAPCLERIAAGLRRDGYAGSISLESVYRPPGGSFKDGFRASAPVLKALFA